MASQIALRPEPVQEAATLGTNIANRLRVDIMGYVLEPARSLQFDWLRGTYKISLSPLRDALTRRAAEGSVTLDDHRGFRVASASVAHLLDLTLVRKETEALGIRLSIERGDDRWESSVLASFHTIAKSPGTGGEQLFDPECEKRHYAFLKSPCSAFWKSTPSSRRRLSPTIR